MSIKEMLGNKRVVFDLAGKTKMEVLDELIDKLSVDGKLTNMEDFKNSVLKREEEFSTGIGQGVAIPHGQCVVVKEPAIVFGRSNSGIDYAAIDKAPVYLFFMVAVPENCEMIHLEILSEIGKRLMNPQTREKLMNAETFENILELF